VLLLVLVVAAPLAAWLGRGSIFWQVPAVLLGVAALGFGVPLFDYLKGTMPAPRRGELAVMGYVLLFAGVWIGVGMKFYHPWATVHVENSSRQSVVIEIDGKPWEAAPPGTRKQASLPAGEHELLTRSASGRELDRRTVEARDGMAYLLNVLGAGTYYRGSVKYGGVSLFGPAASASEVRDVWIDAKVDYLFEEPPRSIKVPVRSGLSLSGTSRSFLTRTRPAIVAEAGRAK
jgi:hypothetical protein